MKTEISFADPKTHTGYRATVDVSKWLMEKLNLLDSGKLVDKASHNVYLAEFRHFANDPKVKFLPKRKDQKKMETEKLTSNLASAYKELCDLITKVMMSHTGNISTVTFPKLKVLSVLADEVEKTVQYNWC